MRTRRAGFQDARKEPRAEIALRRHPLDRPVSPAPNRAAERERCDAARHRIGREEPFDGVERARGQQVHLPAERQVVEQRRGEARCRRRVGRRRLGAVRRRGGVAGDAATLVGRLQDAARQVPQVPRDVAVVVAHLGVLAARRRGAETRGDHASAVGPVEQHGDRRAHARPDFDELAAGARGHVAGRVNADEVGPGRKAVQMEAAPAIAERQRAHRTDRGNRHCRAGNRRARVVDHHAFHRAMKGGGHGRQVRACERAPHLPGRVRDDAHESSDDGRRDERAEPGHICLLPFRNPSVAVDPQGRCHSAPRVLRDRELQVPGHALAGRFVDYLDLESIRPDRDLAGRYLHATRKLVLRAVEHRVQRRRVQHVWLGFVEILLGAVQLPVETVLHDQVWFVARCDQ